MKIENCKLKIICLLVVFVVLVVFPKKAIASELSLGITPPLLQIEAIPPASVTTPITISNLGDESVELKIIFKPFTAAGSEDGTPQYLSKNVSFPGANPLIFQKIQIRDGNRNVQSVLLAPRQEKNLTLHIGVTKDEPLSDYYFSIVFVSNSPTDDNENNLTQAAGGVATNILLSVGQKGKAKGLVEEFSAPFFFEAGPVPFTVRIKNTSSHFISPTGEILIKNMFGQPVGRVDLLPVNILAGTIRAIPDSLQSPDATPSAAMNHELLTMNSPKAFWYESFLLGPYTAQLTIALSEQGPRYVKTIHFVGFPGQALLAIAISLIFVLIIKDRLRRKLD